MNEEERVQFKKTFGSEKVEESGITTNRGCFTLLVVFGILSAIHLLFFAALVVSELFSADPNGDYMFFIYGVLFFLVTTVGLILLAKRFRKVKPPEVVFRKLENRYNDLTNNLLEINQQIFESSTVIISNVTYLTRDWIISISEKDCAKISSIVKAYPFSDMYQVGNKNPIQTRTSLILELDTGERLTFDASTNAANEAVHILQQRNPSILTS